MRKRGRCSIKTNRSKLRIADCGIGPKSEIAARHFAFRSSKSEIAAGCLTVIALALLLPLRLFEIGNPDWRPLGWVHAAIVVGLTFIVL